MALVRPGEAALLFASVLLSVHSPQLATCSAELAWITLLDPSCLTWQTVERQASFLFCTFSASTRSVRYDFQYATPATVLSKNPSWKLSFANSSQLNNEHLLNSYQEHCFNYREKNNSSCSFLGCKSPNQAK